MICVAMHQYEMYQGGVKISASYYNVELLLLYSNHAYDHGCENGPAKCMGFIISWNIA